MLFHNRSQQDAYQVVDRIRATSNPIEVLSLIKQADLLLPNPPADVHHDSQLDRLDAESLNASYIKVPARPWTMIAGNGIVSELVSAFFANDHGCLTPFIHQAAFLEDMRSQSVQEARYCCPALVNAICALKCVRNLPFIAPLNY